MSNYEIGDVVGDKQNGMVGKVTWPKNDLGKVRVAWTKGKELRKYDPDETWVDPFLIAPIRNFF